MAEIFKAWIPLALSWFFMALELPFTTAFLSRLPHERENLASFGGIAFPLAILIEAPIIMLLSASTALCKNAESYRMMRRVMMQLGLFLTLVHILIVLPPFFDLIVVKLIGTPEELQELVRLSLLGFIPWSWSVGHRRFQQGILIRFNRAGIIGYGTAIRIATLLIVLVVGMYLQTIPGAMLGGLSVCVGAVSEAIFISIFARPCLRMLEGVQGKGISQRDFTAFYIPLVLTSIIGFLNQPIGSAAITRMPQSLESLAVWPVIAGYMFLFRAWGIALQEVVIARFDREGEPRRLYRFAWYVSLGASIPFTLFALHPVHNLILMKISGLTPDLAIFAGHALLFGIPLSFMSAFTSYYQGVLVHKHKTRSVTASICMNLLVCSGILTAGVIFSPLPAVQFALIAYGAGMFAQLISLWSASYAARRDLTPFPDVNVSNDIDAL